MSLDRFPNRFSKQALAVGALLGITPLLWSHPAFAWAPDSELMKIKGYSPEVITATSQQRNRQEWKEPAAPKLSPVEKFFHNIYYGDWTGSVDDFGSQIIREN